MMDVSRRRHTYRQRCMLEVHSGGGEGLCPALVMGLGPYIGDSEKDYVAQLSRCRA